MSVQTEQLAAKVRQELGSRANKRLRDAGFIPGVVYGHKEAVIAVSLPRLDAQAALAKGLHVLDLQIDGKSEKVLVKDVQYDHLQKDVLHIDFARVSLDERVKVSVPVELRGTPKGEDEGGVLQQIIAALEIDCLVVEIPKVVRHSVADMALNTVLKIKDLSLPPGVKCLQDPELIVATVREIKEELPVAAAPAEAGAAEPEVIGRKAEGEEEAAAEGAAPAEEKKKEKAKE
jgi:large subunit ribosomal protein L25